MKTYEVILSDIQEKIEQGIYKPKQQLPSLREFAKIYHTTPVTMKKSLSILEEKGYVYVIDRKGFFVTSEIKKVFQMNFNEIKSIDCLTDIRLLKTEIVSTDVLSSECGISLSENDKCLKISRLLLNKTMPVGLDIRYIAYHSKVILNAGNTERLMKSIEIVLNNYDVDKEMMITVMTDNAPIRDLLYLGEDESVFLIRQIFRTRRQQFVAFSKTYIPCEEVTLKMHN